MEKLRDNSSFWSELVISISEEDYGYRKPIKTLKLLQEINLKYIVLLDDQQKIYNSLEDEFLLFNALHYKKEKGLENLPLLEINELKGVFSWALFCIKNFKGTTLDEKRQILLILYIFSCLDKNIWIYIPIEYLKNTILQEFLATNFISFKFQYLEKDKDPIWEREAVSQYIHAVKTKDWIILANKWHIFGHNWRLQANFLQKQILLYFFKSSWDLFIRKLNYYNEFILLMLLFRDHTFTLKQRLALAYKIDNELVCFALLFSLELNNANYKELSGGEAKTFSKILKKFFDKEPDLLDVWLKIFNKYLIRFPIFAKGFGIYLAHYADSKALDSYLNSVEVCPLINNPNHLSGDKEREIQIQTVVFKAFEAESVDVDQTNFFWEKCYLKWNDWQFLNPKYLFNVIHSSFDYAVIKYLIAEKKNEDLLLEIDLIFKSVERALSHNWFASYSKYVTFINQKKSRLQIYCHVNNVLNGIEQSILIPIDRIYSFTEITDVRTLTQ